MIAELLPAGLLTALDETAVMDDRMCLTPTAYALRALHFRDLWDRAMGLKPPGFYPNPLSAQIEFTQRCNLTCDFCYNDSGPRNVDELDLPVLERVCRELADMGIVELIISGGEPLVRPRHLEAVLETFQGTGIPIHLLTNGILLTHPRLEWLRRYNVVTLQVSLDGADPAVHDRQRGVPGAWGRALAGLSRAHEHGFYTIVSCTLTRENADSVGDLVDYCYLAGADKVNAGDLITWGRAQDWVHQGACTNDQYDRVAEVLRDRRSQYDGHMEIQLAVNMLYYMCQIRIRGQESLLIRGNGNVIPHCTLANLVVGNVRHQSLREIWDSGLKSMSEDPRLVEVLAEHAVVRTERLGQLRCYRRVTA